MGRVIPGGRCHVVDEEGHFTTGGVLSGRGARVTDTVVVVFGRWANDLEGRVTDIPPRGRRKPR